MTTTSTTDPALVISRSERKTTIRSHVHVERERIDTILALRGLAGVVTATDLVTAFSNAIPFAGPSRSREHCLRLQVRDDILVVVATDNRILTKEALPIQKPDGDENPYPVRDGSAVIGVREARYVIKLLGRRPEWPPVRVAFTSTDMQTSSRWADGDADPSSDRTEMSHALTIEVIKGHNGVRAELPAFGPVTPLPYEEHLARHAPAPADTVWLDPELMARFAKVATVRPGGLEAEAASSMTVAMAEAGKPLRVTIGDRFEAIVMPQRAPAGYPAPS
jgi:hypothetical protein